MHVAVVSAVYPPEPMVSARISEGLGQVLLQRGHEVTVLCPMPSRPANANYESLRRHHMFARDEVGLTVIRLPSITAPYSRLFPRMMESLSFGLNVCRQLGRNLRHVDAVYANTWPMFSQYAIARYARRHNIPLVLHIQDVYPESLLARLSPILQASIAAPLRSFDRRIVARATTTVVISESMKRLYVESRQIPEGRVMVCHNWQDDRLFIDSPLRGEACHRYGVDAGKFTFMYLGNFGPVAGVDFLVRAFHHARVPEAQLVLVGDGSERSASIDVARECGVANVVFISDPEVHNVPVLQSMADVCLLPMRRGSGASSIPSKLSAYMFSAKPILATVDACSDTARCVLTARCGWTEEPEDVDGLARRMAMVARLPKEELVRLGRRARDFGLKHFSRAHGAARLAEIVESSASAG